MTSSTPGTIGRLLQCSERPVGILRKSALHKLLPLSIPLLASPQEEQTWNQRQLSQTVTSSSFCLWAYREPAVVLGCSQRDLISPDQVLERAGMGVVTRQTGGGAVLVGSWMLSASIVLPSSHPLVEADTTKSYRWLGELYASVLRELGISAHAITPDETKELQQRPRIGDLGWACYGGYSPWEVVVGQRKIVGLAQARRRTGVILVTGLLLNQPKWKLLTAAMDKPAVHANLLDESTTSCAEQCGRELPLLEIAYPLGSALQNALGFPADACDRISTTPSMPGWYRPSKALL